MNNLRFEYLPEVLSVQQVADYLGVAKNTVYNWINKENLPSWKAGNTRRIRKSALLQWMQEREMQEVEQGHRLLRAVK